jgi:hypothetical protein
MNDLDSVVYVHQLSADDVRPNKGRRTITRLFRRNSLTPSDKISKPIRRTSSRRSSRSISSAVSNLLSSASSPIKRQNSNDGNEFDYSDKKRRKGRRKSSRIAPPPPNSEPRFPIHNPPTTPTRSLRHMLAFGDNEPISAHLDPALRTPGTSSSNRDGFLTPTSPDVDPNFDLSLDPDPPHTAFNLQSFESATENERDARNFVDLPLTERQSSIKPEPDLTAIKLLSDRFYPQILKQHAPATNEASRCFSCNKPKYVGTPTGDGPEEDNYLYRCESCCPSRWICSNCMVSQHKSMPLHRVVRWDHEEFRVCSTSLCDLGLVVRFCSALGNACDCPSDGFNLREMEVLDTNGVHSLRYVQCHCERLQSPQSASCEQILSNRLWPATQSKVMRSFTFEVLNRFDLLNLHGYINVKQFLDATTQDESVCTTVVLL